jgi:outer membrane protein assembly factor BamB
MQIRSDLRKHLLQRSMLAAMLCFVCFSGHVQAMQPPADVEQRGLQQLILETEESLASQSWLEAAERLDKAWEMACEDEDPLMVATGADVRQLAAGETEILAGGKARLESLYYSSPAPFRTEFARQFSELAESKLSDAVSSGDFTEVRRLATRYAFCPAARNTLLMMTSRSLDRGDFLEAALLLSRVQRMNAAPDTALILQMAVCYARAGLITDATDVILQLRKDSGAETVNVRGENVRLPGTPAEILEWLKNQTAQSNAAGAIAGGTDWLQPGGSYRRLAPRLRGPAGFRTQWKSNLFEVQDVLYSEQYNPLLAEFRDPVERESLRLLQRNSTIVPAGLPLVMGQQAIFRTPFGIRSVNMLSGELTWEVTRPDSRLKTILDERAAESENASSGRDDFGLRAYVDPRAQLLYQMIRTNTASQMAINGRTLFVVDECANATWNDDMGGMLGPNGSLSILSNYIRAYDAESGLFRWEAGGQTQNVALPAGQGNLLAGFYFLGAPLVLGQRTYVLAESGEGIFLIQIAEPVALADKAADADSGLLISDAQASVNPKVVKSQILTVPEYKLPQHPVRKHAGLMPSFAQGMLICPTCDQRIVAVSAEDHSLRWIFRYAGNTRVQEIGGENLVLFGGRDVIDTKSVDMDSRWIDSLARIVNGKVLITPRDSDQLYCLDLQTGLMIWSTPRNVFHAIGTVTSDKVVLVGNQRVAAFSMTDGRLIWSTELRDGVVCGTATSDGTIIQIPTSEPSIVSLDLETGRRLAGQSEDLDRMPGNLLMTEHGLLLQNLLDVSFAATTSPEQATPVEQATDKLLNRQFADAKQILDQEVTARPTDLIAREMLIELLLEGMRADFSSSQADIPRVRELIELSASDVPIAPLLHSLLGLNLPDAAVLPRQVRGQSNQYQGELSELIAQGMAADSQSSAEALTANIRQLLNELPAARRQVVTTGFMIRTKATILTSGIRRALQNRTAPEREQIAASLQESAMQIFQALPDNDTRLNFLSSLLAAELPLLVHDIIKQTASDADAEARASQAALLQEFAMLRISQSDASNAAPIAGALLDSWKSLNHTDAIQTWLTDLARPVSPQNTQHFQMPDVAMRDKHLEAWKLANPNIEAAVTSVWNGVPQKEESPERTMMEQGKALEGIPDKLIPLYGNPGIYRDWSFARVRPAGDLYAYDADGNVRWKLRPYGTPDDARYGFAAESYVMTVGHLLIINLSGNLFAVDPSQLNREGEPRELWRKNTAQMPSDADADQYRDYVPPADRVPQYFPQPAGYFPVGPVTQFGIPVISGRRLMVLDPLTGDRTWQTDGIPRDTTLLCSGDQVLLISYAARQIEVRSLVDGSVRSVSPLPEWWGDANDNVGSSVRDIEVEADVEVIWRIILQGQSCLLFRLTAGRSILESRDLLTDKALWSIELPQDTVFSNVADDVVGLLSDGQQLKLVETDTGRILADLPVTAVTAPRELILRKSSGHFVVLPDAVEPNTEEYDPIIDAIHVCGRIYAVREETMELAWDLPIDSRHIRLAIPERSVLLPNVPVLLLLSRGRAGGPAESVLRRTHYGALVLDVRTGEELYRDDEVGTTLNNLWMHIDTTAKKLQMSFDSRIVTLDYSGSKPPNDEQSTQK